MTPAAQRWTPSAWLHATDVLASTLRGYISLQKKHQDELRAFSSTACRNLDQAAVGSASLRGVLTHVSELFAHAASAPEELCVNLPLDIDELQTELQRQVNQMDRLVQDAHARQAAFEGAKHTYTTTLTAFHDAFALASRLLSRAIDNGIDPNTFLDADDATAILITQATASTHLIESSPSKKAVSQVTDAIRRAKDFKAKCMIHYKQFRKVAGEYAQALDVMTATQQYDLVQLHGSVEAEQSQVMSTPLQFVGHAADIHVQMQALPPPLSDPLELSYFLEQHFPTTQVRPLLVRHQPRASMHAA
ncbi:hypothetical protein DYB26_001535 [Aphanomyces astaci]|uniref:Uncharacterized protein n=2 Tax=Aphanomyces astaci TaxID=112090 RepID=A0A397F8U1_APHAT|nr:hypothetical protein DYB26_001535 [Aphanomyces astaci]RHZ19970.1 hypothetical protein DYB31_003809 [Aphanomyces astaci]